MAQLPNPIPTLSGEGRAIFDELQAEREAKGSSVSGPYVPLMNHPQLAKRVEELGFFLKFEGSLPRPVYQFVVLSVAKRSGVAFVWEDHVAAARAAGVPETLIGAISAGSTAYDPPYDLAFHVMDCAFAYRSIPADLQDRAIAAFGIEGFIEIVVLCGEYVLMSMVNGCFDVSEPKGRAH
jgi:4-carboxymuconolactone decarboxylase